MTGKTACWRWERLEFSIRRTFPDISGHSAPASGSVSDSVDDGLPGGWDRWGVARFLVIRRCVASVAWLNFVCVLRQALGDKLRDGRREVVPDRRYSREGFHGLGTAKCQAAGAEGQSHLNRALIQQWLQCRVSGVRQLRILRGVASERWGQGLRCDCPYGWSSWGHLPANLSYLRCDNRVGPSKGLWIPTAVRMTGCGG